MKTFIFVILAISKPFLDISYGNTNIAPKFQRQICLTKISFLSNSMQSHLLNFSHASSSFTFSNGHTDSRSTGKTKKTYFQSGVPYCISTHIFKLYGIPLIILFLILLVSSWLSEGVYNCCIFFVIIKSW